MTVILGYAKLMERSLTDKKDRERARIIGEQTQRVKDLIQTLLNIYRPHPARHEFLSGSARTLDHALRFYQEGRNADRKMEGRFSAVAQPVFADRDQLETVF